MPQILCLYPIWFMNDSVYNDKKELGFKKINVVVTIET
jgi:hypothetical protein